MLNAAIRTACARYSFDSTALILSVMISAVTFYSLYLCLLVCYSSSRRQHHTDSTVETATNEKAKVKELNQQTLWQKALEKLHRLKATQNSHQPLLRSQSCDAIHP